MFEPFQYHALTGDQAALVQKVSKYTENYFQDPKFDSSHDFNHVLRVTALAIRILEEENSARTGDISYDTLTVILGALLHDVDDRKYRVNNTEALAEVQKILVNFGLDSAHAARVQILVDGVSYSSEIKNPQRVRDLIVAIPELAIVQDADRLDAIGAVGIGRCFAYGAAKTTRDLSHTMEHFDDKLFKLERMMKTSTGQSLAAKYTARLKEFKEWWTEELDFAGTLP